MKPIILANLCKDYPNHSEWIQEVMKMKVNISREDVVLIESLEENVKRWKNTVSHLPNIRKRLFSTVQRDAYKNNLGFFNTKSEIAKAAQSLGLGESWFILSFLLNDSIDTDGLDISNLLRSLDIVQPFITYKSKNGCIGEIFKNIKIWRTYFSPVGNSEDNILVLYEEEYTGYTNFEVLPIDKKTWEMLLKIDLEEISNES
jgi:hypothetical protein